MLLYGSVLVGSLPPNQIQILVKVSVLKSIRKGIQATTLAKSAHLLVEAVHMTGHARYSLEVLTQLSN